MRLLSAIRMSYRLFPSESAKVTVTVRRWAFPGYRSSLWMREWAGAVK